MRNEADTLAMLQTISKFPESERIQGAKAALRWALSVKRERKENATTETRTPRLSHGSGRYN